MELKARSLKLEEELIQVRLSWELRCQPLAATWEWKQGCQDSGLTSELVASCSPHMLVGLFPPFLKWMEPLLGVTALLFLGLQYSPMNARHLLPVSLDLVPAAATVPCGAGDRGES